MGTIEHVLGERQQRSHRGQMLKTKEKAKRKKVKNR